ncbi:uncharacterized protein K460DRAFT_379282 [Cucurbitaria berberidis CBS 394.84]|uniref:Phosphatidate phosphatase APP1 catalytic domain-containing protein n=1 Tax=Cucurbitaria berberidis CBS 394.84 TaxID=1168544 RepID=A0A9P4GFN8_9PLEO|nr:uncharacterized protein K460DRAFT_379282 [Cucurbitaria berberidis CBS 394.84]KAF1844315.1 hypothetical protein K460DRAFT_379282 [Cucurbitaria berberidis CBS 394.84]
MAPESASAAAGRTRQYFQESEEDRITRTYAKFPEFEADMPKLVNRFQFSFKDNITSYLGRNNPFYQNVNPETDYVWLLDTTAFQNRLGRWKAEFVAAYFVQNSGKDVSEVVAWVSEKIGLADDEEAKATIAKRIQPFADSILPAHAVEIDLFGMNVRLGPSGRDGISSDELAVPGTDYKDGEVVTSKAINADATPFNITFAKPKGWAVLSDIDDTIKKTLTSSPVGILTTTFAEEPEPIKGMPELYKHIVQKLENPPFWYLSASPYNLYPFLRDFRETYYPSGTMILRDASWMNLGGFLANLTQGTESYKVDRLEKVNGWFPKRKFIVIGDSTQSDPEAYGEAYRRHPKWIGAIYIRKVTGVAEMDENKKNDPERFERAFKDVPRDIWYVFEDPQELYAKIDALPQINMAKRPYDDTDPRPMYMLLVLAIALCAYSFWIGTVCVRLYFYKGALGPEPEKFIILTKELKERYRKSMLAGNCDDVQQDLDYHSTTVKDRRITVFPHVAPPGPDSPETMLNTALDPRRFSTLPTINLQDVADSDDFDDPKLRSFVAEEVRISRLPAFVQDDCGDGSEFPDIPIALEPIEEHAGTPDISPLRKTEEYLRLGLKRVDRSEWLAVDNTYIEFHDARHSLLKMKETECIQVKQEGETACAELMHEIVEFVTEKYPHHFNLPDILKLSDLSPYSFAPSLMSRTETYIQTRPDRRTLGDVLHIQRPADFFAGNIFNLTPKDLLVRRETQIFRRLPKSAAIVFSSKTSTTRLVELSRIERRELLREVEGWNEDVARFKGRDLWITAVEGYCLGKPVFRDDTTVFSRGS